MPDEFTFLKCAREEKKFNNEGKVQIPKIIKGGDDARNSSTGSRDHKAQGSKVKPKPSSFESQMPLVRKEVDAG